VNITLCVWTSDYACEHHTISVVFWKFVAIKLLTFFSLILGGPRGGGNYPHYPSPSWIRACLRVEIIFCVRIALCINKSHSCVLKSNIAFRNYTCACVHHTQEWLLHAEKGFNTYKSHNQFRECHNHTHTCQHHTLRVEITLVRIEISVVSVEITVVRFNITMCVEITLCGV
jgi:hypothetical protein